MQRRDTIWDADTGNEIFDELMQTWKTEGTDADADHHRSQRIVSACIRLGQMNIGIRNSAMRG